MLLGVFLVQFLFSKSKLFFQQFPSKYHFSIFTLIDINVELSKTLQSKYMKSDPNCDISFKGEYDSLSTASLSTDRFIDTQFVNTTF
jgi:hypothetical protein